MAKLQSEIKSVPPFGEAYVYMYLLRSTQTSLYAQKISKTPETTHLQRRKVYFCSQFFSEWRHFLCSGRLWRYITTKAGAQAEQSHLPSGQTGERAQAPWSLQGPHIFTPSTGSESYTPPHSAKMGTTPLILALEGYLALCVRVKMWQGEILTV